MTNRKMNVKTQTAYLQCVAHALLVIASGSLQSGKPQPVYITLFTDSAAIVTETTEPPSSPPTVYELAPSGIHCSNGDHCPHWALILTPPFGDSESQSGLSIEITT